jgi:hypothetical protein
MKKFKSNEVKCILGHSERELERLRVRLRMRPAQSRCTQPGDVSHQDWRFPAVSRVRQRGLRHSIWLNLIAEAHSQTDSKRAGSPYRTVHEASF